GARRAGASGDAGADRHQGHQQAGLRRRGTDRGGRVAGVLGLRRDAAGGGGGGEAGILHHPRARLDAYHRSSQHQAGRVVRASRMRDAVDRIEALIHQEVGRNIAGLFASAKGGLWNAASSLAAAPLPSMGIITGFYVPLGTPPAAETDGPVGAALLAGALTRVGVACRLVTDEPCRATCAAALHGTDVPL